MRVLLVDPQTNLRVFEPPLGVVYIGTATERTGHECYTHDLNFDESVEGTLNLIESKKFDILGLSTTSMSILNALEIAQHCKQVSPETLVVFGGPHATALPFQTIAFPQVDVIIVGEGETTFVDLLEAVSSGESLSKVPGIFFKQDGQPVHTEVRQPVANLDEIPRPDRSLLDTFRQHLAVEPRPPLVSPCTTVLASRGCPGRCSFCQPLSKKIFGKRWRRRSPENIVLEISLLIDEFGIQSVQFADDTLTAHKEWMKDVGREMASLDLPWAANARVDWFDEEMSECLADGGCVRVYFGIESGSPRILKILDKDIEIEQTRRAVTLCKMYGMECRVGVMIGSPTETCEDVKRTIDLLKAIQPDSVDVHFTKPTPGSALFDRYVDYVPLEDYPLLTDRHVPQDGLSCLSVTELLQFKEEIETLFPS